MDLPFELRPEIVVGGSDFDYVAGHLALPNEIVAHAPEGFDLFINGVKWGCSGVARKGDMIELYRQK